MIKKFFSVQLLIILSLSIIGCNDNRSYLEKGIELFEKGEYKGSAIEIKNAIQEDPTISAAFYYMALLDEKAKRYKAMRISLLESVKLDPDNIKAKLKLGKLFLLFNEIDSSLKEIESILIKHPNQLDAFSIKASILIRQGKVDSSLVLINDILQKDPGHIEATSLKAVVLMKKELFKDAENTLIPAIQKNPDNISLLLLKTQLDSKLEDTAALIEDYEKLAALKPDNIKLKLTLSHAYFKANKKDKSEEILRSLVEKNPGLHSVEIELLELLYALDQTQVSKQINLFLKQNNNYVALRTYHKWYIRKNKNTEAKTLLEKALLDDDLDSSNINKVKLLLVKHEISDKNFNRALQGIENVLKSNATDYEALLLKAQILSTTEKYTDATTILEKILLQKPRMDKAISLLGATYEVQGDLEQAYTFYKDALKINPRNLRALNFIVSKEVNENHAGYAIELLETTLRYIPSQLVLMTKLVELNIKEKNWNSANKYIERIRLQKNGRLLAHFFKGQILQEQNQCKDAITIYKDLLKSSPWLNDVLIAISDCYSTLNQKTKRQEYLDTFIKSNPNITSVYILKSQLLLQNKQVKKASTLLKNALQNDKLNHIVIYAELAKLFQSTGNHKAEYTAYKDGLKIAPNNISLMLPLAIYHEKTGEFDKATSLYEEILKINPKLNVVKNNFATILLDHLGTTDNINKALQLTQTFKQSTQPYFLDTYGWALLKSGKIEKAISIFKKVTLLAPNTAVFHYHLGFGYYQLDDMMAASVELRQALYSESKKDFPEKVLIQELLAKIKKR